MALKKKHWSQIAVAVAVRLAVAGHLKKLEIFLT